MKHQILVFGTGDVLPKKVMVTDSDFERIKSTFQRRGVTMTGVFLGNDRPESIAVFTQELTKTLQEITNLRLQPQHSN